MWSVSRRRDMGGNTTYQTFKTFAQCINQAWKWYERYGLQWGIIIRHYIPEARLWAEVRFYYKDPTLLKYDVREFCRAMTDGVPSLGDQLDTTPRKY